MSEPAVSGNVIFLEKLERLLPLSEYIVCTQTSNNVQLDQRRKDIVLLIFGCRVLYGLTSQCVWFSICFSRLLHDFKIEPRSTLLIFPIPADVLICHK